MPDRSRRYAALACAVLVSVFALMWIWIEAHPRPTGWDEAWYLNQVLRDAQHFQERGLHGLASSLRWGDRVRPPAHRLFTLPLSLSLGVTPGLVRLGSLVLYGLSLVFLYRAVRLVAGRPAGWFALATLAACPVSIWPIMRFGTEAPLFLALAMTLFYVARVMLGRFGSKLDVLGLGSAVVLGLFSKLSYPGIGGPLILGAVISAWHREGIRGPTLARLVVAGAGALVVVAPLYIWNGPLYFVFATAVSDYYRQAIVASGPLGKLAIWLELFAGQALGPGVALLLLVVLLRSAWRLMSRTGSDLETGAVPFALTCLAASLPVLALHLTGSNHQPRHVAPAVVPLVAGASVLAFAWARDAWSWAALALLAGGQAVVMLGLTIGGQSVPLESRSLILGVGSTGRQWVQWDLDPLYEAVARAKTLEPRIAFLGNGESFNAPQIEYPWAQRHQKVSVHWLWRFEQGEIDWDSIDEALDGVDAVLTVPGYRGNPIDRQELDNQHNHRFDEALAADPRFSGPVRLPMGDGEGVIHLYLSRSTLAEAGST